MNTKDVITIFDDIIEKHRSLIDYLTKRCLAAEKYLELTPCDPDVTDEQFEAYKAWMALVQELEKHDEE